MTTPLCFLDTETTSVRPDRRAWDIALVRRDPDGTERIAQFWVDIDDLDLPEADPFSLNVGRFWERHPQAAAIRAGQNPDAVVVDGAWRYPQDEALLPGRGGVVSGRRAALIVAHFTHGAHLVGAVPNFDAEVLTGLLRDNSLTPTWHYHLIDVESLAVGYLAAVPGEDDDAGLALPWQSDDLAAMLGVDPPTREERHTALGDARWAQRIYDRIMEGQP